MEKKAKKTRKYTKLMQILISPALDKQLRELSEEKQLRYSEIVRAALTEYIQKQNQINKLGVVEEKKVGRNQRAYRIRK